MSELDSIKIKGFKSIKEADIELSNLNLLIGPNGVGKSNFISLFELFNNVINKELQNSVAKKGGADTFAHYGSKATGLISFDLSFKSNSYHIRLEPTDDDRLLIKSETGRFYTDEYSTPFNLEITSNEFESRINEKASIRKNVAYYVRLAIKNWRVYHFHDTSDTAPVKKTCDIDDNFDLKKDASNLSAYLYRLKEKAPRNFSLIERTVKRIFPSFGAFILEPSRLNEGKIKLEWREEGNSKYFDANSLSDGTLRFISLATLLLQPELPSTIIIDEPELGLHPKAISILASLFRKARNRTQLIISTQSVNLVNEFEAKDIIVLDRVDGQTTFNQFNDEKLGDWLNDYTMGELWEKNLLGGRP